MYKEGFSVVLLQRTPGFVGKYLFMGSVGSRVHILCAVAAAAELCAENVFGFYTTSRVWRGEGRKKTPFESCTLDKTLLYRYVFSLGHEIEKRIIMMHARTISPI